MHTVVPSLASTSMAQLGFNEPNFEPLPGPGVIEHALLESPWLVAGALAVAGLALGWWLLGHGKRRRGLIVGGGLGAAAIVLVAIAHLVKTDREAVISRTRALIASIADADPQALDDLLLDGGYLIPQRGWGEVPKDRVLGMVRWAAEHEGRYTYAGLPAFGIEAARVRQVRAQVLSDSIARTQVNVVVTEIFF